MFQMVGILAAGLTHARGIREQEAGTAAHVPPSDPKQLFSDRLNGRLMALENQRVAPIYCKGF